MDLGYSSSQDLLELPIEVLERIFGRLDGYSVHNVLLTCRTLRGVADSVAVWSQISDSFWDNLDGSQVTVSRLRSPKSSDGTSSLRGSLGDSGRSDSGSVGYAGPLRRSHGKRKLIRDGSEVLHQIFYQHRFHAPILYAHSELVDVFGAGVHGDQQQQTSGNAAMSGKTEASVASPVSLTMPTSAASPIGSEHVVQFYTSVSNQIATSSTELNVPTPAEPSPSASSSESGGATTTAAAQSTRRTSSGGAPAALSSLATSLATHPPPAPYANPTPSSSPSHGLGSHSGTTTNLATASALTLSSPPASTSYAPIVQQNASPLSSTTPASSGSLLIPSRPLHLNHERSPFLSDRLHAFHNDRSSPNDRTTASVFSSSVGSSDTHSTSSGNGRSPGNSPGGPLTAGTFFNGLSTLGSSSFGSNSSGSASTSASAPFVALGSASSPPSQPTNSGAAPLANSNETHSFGITSSSSSASSAHSHPPHHVGLLSASTSTTATEGSSLNQLSTASSTSSSVSSLLSSTSTISSSSSSRVTPPSSSDPNYLADSIATLSLSRGGPGASRRIGGFTPIPQAQSWHGQRPTADNQQVGGAEGPSSLMHTKSTPLRHTTSSPVPRPLTPGSGGQGSSSSSGSSMYGNSYGYGSRSSGSGSSSAGSTGEIVDLPPFRELDISDAPDEDVLRRWLPTEEEITYILKENHHVTVEDFKVYYRLISTCLIVDPSLNAPPTSAAADPMTIVTQMSPVSETLEQKLLRANQELWTFGSPHRPLRRRRIFASLPEAIRHAREGDFIYLHKGVYNESLTITKPIRLCGQMRIQDSIFLQAQINRTIHWRAPPLSRPRRLLPLPLSSSAPSSDAHFPLGSTSSGNNGNNGNWQTATTKDSYGLENLQPIEHQAPLPASGDDHPHHDHHHHHHHHEHHHHHHHHHGGHKSSSSPPTSPRSSPPSAYVEPYVRGSISCIDFSAELLNGEPSLIVHPRGSVDVHHSLFRNRKGTGIRVMQHASTQLLRTTFAGNMHPLDISPQCTSLGLSKNIYRDPLSPELVSLAKDLSMRTARHLLHPNNPSPHGSSSGPNSPHTPNGEAKCCPTEVIPPGSPAPLASPTSPSSSANTSNAQPALSGLTSTKSSSLSRLLLPICVRPEAKFFPETILSFVDMLHLKDFKDKAVAALVPDLIPPTMAILAQFGPCNLPLAQNLLAALHIFAKVEPSRSCINANDGMKIVCDILKKHEMDLFVQLEGISTIWHLSAHDAQRSVVESLPLEEVIIMAIEHFVQRSSLVLVALGALWNLSWLSDKCSARIAPHMDKLFCIQRMYLTNEQIQCNICGLLWNVATHPTLAPTLAKLNPIEHILPALRQHSTSFKLFKPACSLLNFLFNTRTDQRLQFVQAGGIPILIEAMQTFSTTNLDLFFSLDSLFSVLWEGYQCSNEFDQHNGLFAILKASYAYFGTHRTLTTIKPIPATVAVILPQAPPAAAPHAAPHAQPLQQPLHAQPGQTHGPGAHTPQPSMIQRTPQPQRSVSHGARPKPLADLKIFSYCMQRKLDIARLLSVMNLVCNIKTTQVHKLAVTVDVAADSTTFEELHSALKNADEGQLHLFIATVLKLVLSKDPSRLFAVRGGALDLLTFLTASLVSSYAPPGSSLSMPSPTSSPYAASFSMALATSPAGTSSAPSSPGVTAPAPSFANHLSVPSKLTLSPTTERTEGMPTEGSAAASPSSSAASPSSLKRNRLRTAVKGNIVSLGATDLPNGGGVVGVGGSSSGPDSARTMAPLTIAETISIEIAKMIFDCYAMLASMFDLDSRAGRLNQSVYQEYFTSLEKFERALQLVPKIPQQLISWSRDRHSSLLSPLELQGQQAHAGPADVSHNAAARRFTNLKLSNSWLVVSPAVSLMQDSRKPLYLDTRFKTRSMLVKSDYATIWNPHGSLESIRGNHFASSGTVYFELELLRFDLEREWSTGPAASAPFAVGWCTARSVFYSAKVGVANEPHCWSSDPRRRPHAATAHRRVLHQQQQQQQQQHHHQHHQHQQHQGQHHFQRHPQLSSPTPVTAASPLNLNAPFSSLATPTKHSIVNMMMLTPNQSPLGFLPPSVSPPPPPPLATPSTPTSTPTTPPSSSAPGFSASNNTPSSSSSSASLPSSSNTTTADILSMMHWSAGDRVQCFINIDKMQIWYGLNGIWLDEPSFTHFHPTFDASLDIGYAPAISLYQECEAKFHHGAECIHSPPPQ